MNRPTCLELGWSNERADSPRTKESDQQLLPRSFPEPVGSVANAGNGDRLLRVKSQLDRDAMWYQVERIER